MAADRLDCRAVRLDAKTGHRQIDRLPQLWSVYAAALAAVDVNPVIRPPLRRVDPALDYADLEAGEKRVPHLGFSVTIAIREKNNVRRTNSNNSVARRADTETCRQSVGPNFGAIHRAVAVVIDHFFDCPKLLSLGAAHGVLVGCDAPDDTVKFAGLVQFLNVVLTLSIVAVEFADEEVAVRVPADTGGLADERLGDDELQSEAIRQLHPLEAFSRRQRLGCVNWF